MVMETTETPKRRRRTNDEILAELKAERSVPKKRVRRTKAQIARDNEKARLAAEEAEAAKKAKYKVVTFLENDFNAFGRQWSRGQEAHVRPGSYFHQLAYDKNGNFILDKTPEEQKKAWGRVRYEVREEPLN